MAYRKSTCSFPKICQHVYEFLACNMKKCVYYVIGGPYVSDQAGHRGLLSGVSRGGLRGVYKSRKCKWLVKVGVSNGVTSHD